MTELKISSPKDSEKFIQDAFLKNQHICLPRVYDVTKHPKYKSGEWSEERCFKKFLECFDTQDDIDGVVRNSVYMWAMCYWISYGYFQFLVLSK